MARIAGIDLPKNKRGIIGLTYVFGVGPTSAKKILAHVAIDENTKVNQWTDEQIAQINKVVADEYTVEGDLRREVALNIKRLKDLGCYRGIRHRKGLPVRGQRTHTNARTRKGPAVAIAGKKSIKAMK